MAAPRILVRVLGIINDIAAAVVATPNSVVATGAAGTIDPSFLPAGVGADIAVLVTSEALSAGAIVNIYTANSVATVRNADSSTSAAGKKASGFVLASTTSGQNASVYRSGMNTQLTGLTPGADYFLGAAGGVTTTAPTASGTTSQYLGTATATGTLDVQLGPAIAVN